MNHRFAATGLRPPASQQRRPHVLVWLTWAIAAVATVQAAPTPPAVLLVIGVSALLVTACAEQRPLARAYPILVAVAAVFALLRVVLTVLTTHGGEDVLTRLPSAQLPALLGGFTVGGSVHRAILLRSFTEGLVVVGVIASLAAFNAVVSHHELLRLLPRAFHELALVVTVGLAFVPSTLAAIATVQEADRARTGVTQSRRGGWGRRLAAVLESGLEKAVLLAESMEARGFGHSGADVAARQATRWALVGLLALAAAAGMLVSGETRVALGLAVLGALAVAISVSVVSRATARPGLRRAKVQRTDLILIAPMLLAVVVVFVLRVQMPQALAWQITTQTLPPMSPLLLPIMLVLALPALYQLRGSERP